MGSPMKETLKNALADAEKTFAYMDADVNAFVDKMKASGPEERMQARLKADRKKADATDKAEAQKIEQHADTANLKSVPSHPIRDKAEAQKIEQHADTADLKSLQSHPIPRDSEPPS